jgi:hypothetical protein
MSIENPQLQYVVERFNWRRRDKKTFHRFPGFTRVASFDTKEDAEQFYRAEEAKARAVVNPFSGTLAPPTEQTDLPEAVLYDWYLERGFEPRIKDQKTGKYDWATWWNQNSQSWTPEQMLQAWEPLHRIQFYRIIEGPKRAVGYALVQINWGYNDEWYYPEEEGGTITKVFRTLEKAEQERDLQNRTSMAEWQEIAADFGYEEAGANQFELNFRLLPGTTPFDPPIQSANEEFGTFSAAEVPFWEIIEIELEGLK